MTKIMVSKKIEDVDIEVSLDSAIDTLIELRNRHSSSYKDLRIEFEAYPYSDSDHPVLYGKRLETDEEYKNRIDLEAKRDATIAQIEYEHYLDLKKKFEGK